MIRIALAKGYLLHESERLFKAHNIIFEESLSETRQLQLDDITGHYRVNIIRPWDVPVFVAQGAADLGIVGDDVLAEQQPAVIRLLTLPFGHCRLVLAGPVAEQTVQPYARIATKYPMLTRQYFRDCPVTIIKLYGSIETAPMTGLSDYIVDLTATGTTLKANGLAQLDTILASQAQLIVNPIRFRFLYDPIVNLVSQLKSINPN